MVGRLCTRLVDGKLWCKALGFYFAIVKETSNLRQLQTAVAALIRLLETFRRRLLNPLITRSRKEDDTMNLKMLDLGKMAPPPLACYEDKLDFKRTPCTAHPLIVL
ncbi:hypothetical protein Trydic_g9680 [Trypoxylus dichotomus]